MQPHQVSGAGASAAQLHLHLQQMQAQALRQQQNANQQQHLMASNGGFGNMSQNVQAPSHFGGQQVDQSHQQGNSQMSQRNSFTSPPSLMGSTSGGMPNNSSMCMLPNQMGNHQQMVQGQPPQAGSGQSNGTHAALLWNAVQASNKPGGNIAGNNPGGMNMGPNANASNLKLGMMNNSQMQGMPQHSKQGSTQGFNSPQLHQQPNFTPPGSAEGNSNNMSSGNMNKELAMLQHLQQQLNENLKNPTGASSNNALLLQQQNLIQQLMRQIQQTQANANSGGSNSQSSQQGIQFPQMNQRPGSSMGPSNQSHPMQRTSATSEMLQQSMNSLLQGNGNSNSSNSIVPGGSNQQQQKSGDQFNFPAFLQRQHSNQQQQVMSNSNQNNTGGTSDGSSFNANVNSNAGNSSNSGMNASGVMNMSLSKNIPQGQHMPFNEHGNQGFGMNQMVDLTPQQKQLLMMNQNRPSSAQGSQGSQHSMLQQELQRKLLQKLTNEKKRQRSGDPLGDDASVNSKQDDDSTGKTGKAKNISKARKKNSIKLTRKTSTDSASSTTESNNKSKSSKEDSQNSNDLAHDAFRDANAQNRGQQPFLDGNFAGGWQSNADLPDRKRIIISIVKLVERMRPDANKMSQKLPLMAKRLEEYLYRSATTKEEYMDSSTLKKRLQRIAHGLGNIKPYQASGADRSTSNNSANNNSKDFSNDFEWFPNLLPTNSQEKRNDLPLKEKEAFMREAMKKQSSQSNGLGGNKLTNQQESDPEASAKAKRKVIRQQQQRLLLLRHASKCKEGPNCKTKFCDQMVALWKHMKNCRDKSCKTPHCLSSRCVLNHYRICKSQKRTDTCEVCSPVMKHIRTQNSPSGDQENDPIECFPINFGNTGEPQGADDVTTSSASRSAKRPDRSNSRQLPNITGTSENGAESPKQNVKILEEIKAAQNKIRQQQILLQQLQNQQLQLLEQQKNSPQPQRGQQLKHQQQFIQQIQQQFQPQQQFCQRELERQMRELERQTLILQRKQQILQRDLETQKGQPQINEKPKEEALEPPESSTSIQYHDDRDPPKSRTSSRRKRTGNAGEQGSSRKNYKAPVKKLRNPNKEKASKSVEKDPPPDDVPSGESKSKPDSTVSIKARNSPTKEISSGSPKSKGLSNSNNISSTKRPINGLSKDNSNKKDNEKPPLKMLKVETTKSSKTEPLVKNELKIKQEPDKSTRSAVETNTENEDEKVLQQGDLETNTSLIPSMSIELVEDHLKSLQKSEPNVNPRKLSQKCLPVVKKLITDRFGWVFRDPVDPEELGLPDYFNVVENPMDLGKIEQQLERCEYKCFELFEKDVRLVFENAILYNGDNSDVGDMAKSLLAVFDKDFKTLMKGMKAVQQNAKRRVDACILCNSHRRLFEPTVLYCNGICGMQRIRRNATYYTDNSKLNHWCTSCYSLMKENEKNILDNGREVLKKDLQNLKNDALPEEAWVQCDSCHNWVHQICALFNGRRNKTSASYTCPKCYIKKVQVHTTTKEKETQSLKSAEELPHSIMSKFIERGVLNALEKEYLSRAKLRHCPIDKVEKVNDLKIRVVSNMEKQHFVREMMLERYANRGYPSEFPVRTKCVLLFQTIHGVDTLLFGMYVYEYGKDCPAPNRRRVYISYLDSIHFFQATSYRTFTYHAIMIEYLKFVKERGFHTAHIWSCPPSKGDDYIFHHHPTSQLTPSDEMLCSWYEDMLKKAKANGVIIEARTLFEEYFKNDCLSASAGPVLDPCSLPYFEGDYLTGEIENILKHLNTEEEVKKKGRENLTSLSGNISNTQQKKKVGNKIGTRSNPGELINQGRDKVMLRLSQTLSTMKRNFIVVQLHSHEVVAAMEQNDDSSALVKDHNSESSHELCFKKPIEIENQHFFGDTSDKDPPQESEFFDSRQQFLNFCQTNHFQFDELRRAKHSTMMVLFHLHNPSAPKFLQQCGSCYREITHGTRYRCNDCSNFDLCQDCYEPVVTGLWAQRDSRFAHDKTHTFTPIDMEAKPDNQRSREERAKSIKTHLELLTHAANCKSPGCSMNNCARMKKLFEHIQMCGVTYKKGCKICARLLSLLSMHSRLCTIREKCPVPFCDQIRQKNRRLLHQQQLMDDRRRRGQNKLHRSRQTKGQKHDQT